jgi:cation transporter-like permease
MAARLATAVHMGRVAESATAATDDANTDVTAAVPIPPIGAAVFTRGGRR